MHLYACNPRGAYGRREERAQHGSCAGRQPALSNPVCDDTAKMPSTSRRELKPHQGTLPLVPVHSLQLGLASTRTACRTQQAPLTQHDGGGRDPLISWPAHRRLPRS